MNRLLQLLFILFIGVTFTACVDQEFDEPPIDGEDPGITPNAKIADIKALYKAGQFVTITEDLTIGGIVVADDRSGNYFRSFILQDETAGIEVRINQTSAYNFYPIGRQLFIKCKGLIVGDYNGVAQLGGYTYIEDGATQLGDIVAINDYIIKGKRVEAPAPKVKKINELTTADISTLIKLENVEFLNTEIGLPYADIIGRASLNRTVIDCSGNKILLRTSGYATFANEKIPEGNGSIVAIYSVFGRDKQLFIRELSDVVLEGTRCTAGGGGGTGNEENISLQEIRNLFKAGTTAGPSNKKISGVVISDRANGNWDSRNLVIQDASGGIAVRFTANHSFNVGDAVAIVISGQELSEFNGLLQVNNVDNALASKTGAGTLPTPREATTAEVKANLENWESTLVKIKNATLSGGSTYAGNRKINDASGNVDLFTRSQASFASQTLPTGTVDVVAVVSQFNNPQLVIRTPNDVTPTGGGGNPGGSDLISIKTLRAAFSGATTTAPAGKKIKGVVISDKDNNNWDGRNLVIQDTSGSGIVVRFTANHSFTLGQEVEVNVGAQELSEFNGLLQVNSVANNLATLIGNGTLPTPREATIAQITANAEAWESTLVKIKNATIASGTYSGSKNVTDGSGTTVMFTRTQATFASQNVPASAVEITAVVSQFTTPQIIIRNTSDVK